MSKKVAGKTLAQWYDFNPTIKEVANYEPVFWVNEDKESFLEEAPTAKFQKSDVVDAQKRLERFSNFIRVAYPETEEAEGIIESGLTSLEEIRNTLNDYYHVEYQGNHYLKRDDTLPIAGTIKARGAIYEVLKYAESLALENGILESIDEDYSIFASEKFQNFFSDYKIVVGTTGNLGISSGVMAAKLGFEVTVHMSDEAKEWKKTLLRSRGVNVVEHNTNFSEAVNQGRRMSDQDPSSYFVDDEHSIDLFLGYTVAGLRLEKQLEEKSIKVDEDHPLFVYLPCGIGGSPGGITFGLKQVYGDNVHCFFAQPTHMPSMMLGLLTKEYDGVNVMDFGIDAKTGMDGLAVPRTSGFVAELMHKFFDGGYTVEEKPNYHFLTTLIDKVNIALEPAAVAGVHGPARLFASEAGQKYLSNKKLTDKMKNATHISWATGGSMVPKEDMDVFYNISKELD